MRVRTYGLRGPAVFVLHGGPGAPGYMAPVARALSDSFWVFEPFQRGSGSEPLTVARHVEDLRDRIVERCGNGKPALVGHSWGAMLALAHATAHPGTVAALVLIGCGTFDEHSRARMHAIIERRKNATLRRRLERLSEEFPDPDRRLRAWGDLIQPLYSHDLVEGESEAEAWDAVAHRETWEDMLRLQRVGVYPPAFATIRVPVLMLHGDDDPHPGEMIRDSLLPHLPQLEYHAWSRCGHYPWLEKAARVGFGSVLNDWLRRKMHAGLEAESGG